MTSSKRIVDRKSRQLSRLRWVIGTPYFVQGSNKLTEIPILFLIKFQLGMDDAGGQLFDALRSIGWVIKPLWGYISDRVRLFGYHRKSWYVLMACLSVAFWFAAALISYLGVTIPLVYFIVFNLGFATYAFVDVVTDAIMVTEGQRLKRVGSFVNFQWILMSIANAGALFAGGWLQDHIKGGHIHLWMVFLMAGIPPMFTAVVGLRNIPEKKQPGAQRRTKPRKTDVGLKRTWLYLRSVPERLNTFRKNNRPLWLLVLFIFFWKFSPAVGFIERSYLIDERGFSAQTFGIILSVGGVTFLVSIFCYRWVVRTFRRIVWYQYLYAMVAFWVLTFPFSFCLYLDPDHRWWQLFSFTGSDFFSLLPEWNRYQWFKLINGTILSFVSIPAFLIPLTIIGCTVKVSRAAVGYAFLTAIANATNMVEDVAGAVLFKLFSSPAFEWLINGFQGSLFEFAHSFETRTLILELFVYISLLFTLLTIPFIELLRRELLRQRINIDLSETND